MAIQYAGLFLDHDNFLTRQNLLINTATHLQNLAKSCLQFTTGGNLDQTVNIAPLPHLPEPGEHVKRGLVLILPYEIVQFYTSNQDPRVFFESFESGMPFADSLGHCWMVWDKQRNICQLIQICMHKQFDNNLENVFIGAIVDFLAIHLPNNATLWTTIDIRSASFSYLASIYAVNGFQNPYITQVDPHGNRLEPSNPYGSIALSRTNDYIDPENIKPELIHNDIFYLLTQYVKVNSINITSPSLEVVKAVENGANIYTERGKKNFCTIQMKFKPSYARWLSKLPMNASTLNIDGTVTQKEVAGAFWLDNPERQSDGTFIWEISVDGSKGLSAIHEERAIVVHGRYNFHTHPRSAYEKYRYLVSHPSGMDYNGYLHEAVQRNTIFHCVITLEGVYIISLNGYWCTRIDELKQKYIVGGNDLVHYILKNFELPTIVPQGLTIVQASKEYCNNINKMALFENEMPVYHCDYLSWDEVFNGAVVEIGYPMHFNQCFATERNLSILKIFHKDAV